MNRLFKKREIRGEKFTLMFQWGGPAEEWEFRLKKRAKKVVAEVGHKEGVD